MNSACILIIDDEPQIQKLLNITLETNGYSVKNAGTAKEGLALAASHPPDLILLDIGLPDMSGHYVLSELRQWYNNPVIILSVQSDEADIIKALDNGANDYLVKPFRTGELLARIRTALRSSLGTDNPLLSFGDITIDFAARTVKKKTEIIKLTATEYTLLSIFVRNEGKALTHRYILKEIWGPSYTEETQYLRVYVAQLRKKLEDDPNQPKHIITEAGIGYRFTG